MATTLTQLQALFRLYVDDSASTIPAATITSLVNDAERLLWQKMCDKDDSFGLRESTGTLVQAQTDYNYPSDILGRNIRALYVYTSGTDPWIKVDKGTYEEVMAEGNTQTIYPYKYCCMDGYVKVGPPPDNSGYTLRIAYIRQPTAMSSGGDSMDSDDEFAEVIAMDAAIKYLKIKGADSTSLEIRRAELIADATALTIPDDLITSKVVWKYQHGL